MARPRSEDKRIAILAAAVQVFAERGLGAAPTSEISRLAGVAEGTLFTYFKTKDELVNALYRDIKLELAAVLLSTFPRRKSFRKRLQHVWEAYVEWGLTHPARRKVLAQLVVSDLLTRASREAGIAPFTEIDSMAREAVQQHVIRRDLPLELISKMLTALAEATMDLIVANPDMAPRYRKSGFDMFWNGIAR